MAAPTSPLLVTRLRRFFVALTAACAVLVVAGWLPGLAIYDDANACLGKGLSALFTIDHGQAAACVPSYVALREVLPTGGAPLTVCVALIVGVGGLVVRAPSARGGWWWLAGSALGSVGSLGWWVSSHVDLGWFSRVELRWPARVVIAALVVLQGMTLVVLPAILLNARSERPRT